MKKTIALTAALIFFLTSTLCFAGYDSSDAAAEVIVDTVALRPLGIAAIGVGTAAFIVSLPFAVISGTTGKTARIFIKAPVDYTFARPLGEFYSGQVYVPDPSKEDSRTPSKKP